MRSPEDDAVDIEEEYEGGGLRPRRPLIFVKHKGSVIEAHERPRGSEVCTSLGSNRLRPNDGYGVKGVVSYME